MGILYYIFIINNFLLYIFSMLVIFRCLMSIKIDEWGGYYRGVNAKFIMHIYIYIFAY